MNDVASCEAHYAHGQRIGRIHADYSDACGALRWRPEKQLRGKGKF
jgi:hypothetical protein